MTGRPSAPISRAHVAFQRTALPAAACHRCGRKRRRSRCGWPAAAICGAPLPFRVHQHQWLFRVPVPDVVRSELVIPFELAGLRIERQDARRSKDCRPPLVAVVIRAGIAGRPVEQCPSSGSYVPVSQVCRLVCSMSFPFQVSEPGSPGSGTVQKRQTSLPVACRRRRRNRAPLLAARGSGDHQIPDHQRRRSGVVVLVPIRHFGFPQQLAGEAIEREQCALSVTMKTRSPATATPRSMPPAALPASPAVRGRWKCQICRPYRHRGHSIRWRWSLHDSAHDHRRGLKACGIVHRENPAGPESRNVGFINLAQS